jgi:hypothetical protein
MPALDRNTWPLVKQKTSEENVPGCWWTACPNVPFYAAAAAYAKRHNKLLRGEISAESQRFIIFAAGGNDGYGNRLPGLVTAFVMALLTDRFLFVHWEDSYPEPCRFDELFAPGQFVVGGRGLLLDIFYSGLPVLLALTTKDRKLKCALSSCTHYDRANFELLATKDLRTSDAVRAQFLVFQSDDYLLPLLHANPDHGVKLNHLLGDWNMFGVVGRFLFHPQLEVAEQATTILGGIGPHVVGLHLRLQKPTPNGSIVRGRAASIEPDAFYRIALLAAYESGLPLNNSTTFYLATDSPTALAKASSFFEPRGLHTVSQHGLSFGNDGDRTTKKSLMAAIVDIMVLSRSASMLGTYGSSFTSVAASLGGLYRYEVKADLSYWRAMPEPCYRFAARNHTTAGMEMLPSTVYHKLCHSGIAGKVSSKSRKGATKFPG